MVTARGSKREAADSPGGEILSRAEPGSNRALVDAWAASFDPSPRAAVLIRLAQTLADEMDSDDWTAPVAREFRVTLDELAGLLAGEGEDDGEAGLRLVMSAEVRDTA